MLTSLFRGSEGRCDKWKGKTNNEKSMSLLNMLCSYYRGSFRNGLLYWRPQIVKDHGEGS